MKSNLAAIALILGLAPVLSEAAVVCRALEASNSTASGTTTIMRRQRPTLGPPTRQWGHKSATFKYQVIAVGPEGQEDIVLKITSVEYPFISSTSGTLKVLTDRDLVFYQLQMSVDQVDGRIICKRE
jgi:hypothetical protein